MLPLIPFVKNVSKTKPPIRFLSASGNRQGAIFSFGTYNRPYENPAIWLQGTQAGYKSPDWRNKVQRKEDATTPFRLSVDDVKYVNIEDVIRYRFIDVPSKTDYSVNMSNVPLQYFNGDPMGSFPSVIDTSWNCYKEARNIALTYKRKYIDEVTRPFQSQVFLGEIKETLDFIRHPFGKLRALANSASVARYNSAIKQYRQAAIKHRGGIFDRTSEARLLLNDVADAWFEVRFALLPLVSDISAAFKVINGRKAVRRSAFRGDAKQTISPFTSSFAMGDLDGYRDVTGFISCKYFIHTGIVFNDATNYEGLPEYLDASLSKLVDFIPTVYELIPGSWLWDYFVNVGDYLNTIAASSKVTLTYSSHTAVVDYTRRATFRAPSPGFGIKISASGSSGYSEFTRRLVERKVDTDNFPSVNFTLPSGMPELANTAFYLSRKFANIFR